MTTFGRDQLSRGLSLVLLLALLFALLLGSAAWAFPVNQCASDRAGSNLGCTANDVSISSIAVAPGSPSSCVGGTSASLDLDITINAANAKRYDIGVFLANDGKSTRLRSSAGGAATCSVAIVPKTPLPFADLDSDGCGDIDGPGSGIFRLSGVTVLCSAGGGSATGNLTIPFLVSWDVNAGNSCTTNADVAPSAQSKCNAPTIYQDVAVVVLPTISLTDGVSTVKPGGTLTYTVVITNSTGSSLSGAVFKDPAVANLSVSSVSCTAASGASCPASSTVAAMQGAGITLPSMPNNGRLTFTVVGTVGNPTSPTTLTNSASVTVSGQTNSASDTDTVMVAPTVTKSFSPSAIASGGTSTLTITLSNPNAVAISGAAFADNYPSNMQNTTPLVLTNTCGGSTPEVESGEEELSLSGGTIPATGSCSVSVRVSATATGVNSSGTVSSSNAASGSAASATLQVISAANSTVVANPTSVPNDGVSASTITVTLKDTAGNPVAGKTITLTAGSGSSIITTVSGTTDASGQATFTVTDTVAQAVTYTGRDTTDSVTITQTATVTFSASSLSSFNAFETSTAANATSGRIYTKLAGTGFGLDVVAIAGSSKATSFNGNVKVELLANTGTAGSGYGTNNCPSSNAVLQTIASTAIASGRSTVNFAAVAGAYRDVRVRISYPTSSPTISICSTDSFVIRPAAFTITSSDASNPGASGSPVIKAGASFNLSATAVAGYDGTPSLDASQVVGSPTAGTLGGSLGVATAGVATGSFTYTEVGNFGLNANAVYDTSFTSIDQPGDCTADFSNTLVGYQYGCKIGSTAVAQTTGSSGFGRFIPDHFDTVVTGSMVCPSGLTCPAGGLVYSGQSFSTQVTARNLSGATTLNYDSAGAYSKTVTLSAWNAGGGSTANPGGGAMGANTVLASAFSQGVAETSTPSYTFPTTPVAPTDIYVRALDTDSVTSLRGVASVEGGIKLVSGRLKIFNAYGSELLPLPLTATVQYWNGTNWVTSTTDSVTAFNTNLNTAGGNVVPIIVAGPLALGNLSVVGAGAVTVAAGVKVFTLNKPGVTGSADISLNAPAYLLAGSNGAGVNPSLSGRATFGLYKSRLIYIRENY